MAWFHALAAAPLDATVAQFEAGPPLPLAIAAVVLGSAGMILFASYGLIAMVFPSGRLPGGRWGRTARLVLVLDAAILLIALVSPRINVNLPGYPNGAIVPNPIALAPDLPIWHVLTPDQLFPVLLLTMAAAAVSLFVRLRRAGGIERQQLRWVSVATMFVVACILAGLALSSLIPATADNGLAWVPAIIAFPTVPISVGVAVLRYRLYEIDTIVNRAIVYGLLTAILAGSSAAVIGVFERLFEGVIGPGSDASIILTTLLVVTAFNPVKGRLQALVDRRFKEVRDPVADLAAFEAEIRGGIARPDRERVMRRLVDVSMAALAATGASLEAHGPGDASWSAAAGTPINGEPLLVSVSACGSDAVLQIAGSPAPRAADALRSALTTALEETSPV